MTHKRAKLWAAGRFATLVLVVGASFYAVNVAHNQNERTCKDLTRLRSDMTFVLTGAGQNERVQTEILMRLGNDQERTKLVATFEPGLASALKRISQSHC
jgi:hypothetical protein